MPSTIEAAREAFPRGLEQPEGAFRFSVDALLLAAFAPADRAESFADLGTGCGVVGLALCLLHPRLSGFGVEVLPQAAAAAFRNAETLGLAERFRILEHNLADTDADFFLQSHDLVVANPPWRGGRAGRPPKTFLRAEALVDKGETLPVFCGAAARLLKHKGTFACVYDSERLPELLEALRGQRLEPKRLRFVHSRAGSSSRIVLVEARKNSRPGVRVEAPLILYAEREPARGPRALGLQPLEFCRFLACNGGGASNSD